MVKPQYYYYQNHPGSGDGNNAADSSWSDYLVDAYAGTAVGLSHFKWFVGKTMGQGLESLLSMVSSGWRDDVEKTTEGTSGGRNSNNSDGEYNKYANTEIEGTTTTTTTTNHGLKVVGVGYGRTGTYSLAIALDMLGFPTLVSIGVRCPRFRFVFK